MTQKKLNMRLTLKKTTISNLTNLQMKKVNGGLMWTDPRACDTDYTCSDFTNAACPAKYQTAYVVPCCEPF